MCSLSCPARTKMVPSFPPINPEPRIPICMFLLPNFIGSLLRNGTNSLDLQPIQLRDCTRSDMVLLITDLFHPVSRLTVELFHNGDVRHGCGWRGAMPMLLTRRDPDHVPRPNLLDRTAPALC